MIQQYLPILVFLVLGTLCGVMPLILGSLLGRKRPTVAKNAPYECGFEPFGDARMKFDVRFYLIAILFIIFDLEMIFLFPFAVALEELSWTSFLGMGLFLLILTAGFIYEWKKGALEWE